MRNRPVLCLVDGGRYQLTDHFCAAWHSQHSFPGLQPACAAAGLTVRYLCKGPQFNSATLEGIKVVIIFADGSACIRVH